MNNLQPIKNNQQNKYNEIIRYLKQDNGYWLENDNWNIDNEVFEEVEYRVNVKNIKLNFIKNEVLKNEVKYYLAYSIKNKYISLSAILNEYQYAIRYLIQYIDLNENDKISLANINIESVKWEIFMSQNGFKITKEGILSCNGTYKNMYHLVSDFIKNFYDDREEIEKDVWNCKTIKGTRFPAGGCSNGSFVLDFTPINEYYRDTVKRYLKTIITKRSYKHCERTLMILKYFFNYFYLKGSGRGFLENLTRRDIEDFIFQVESDYKEKNQTYKSQIVAFIKQFLDYIQLSQYDKAPKKDTRLLISSNDFPRREAAIDVIKRVKFIPEPILKQLDSNIMDLDRPKYIPIYILLRETGWRGTDILNLRYNNCLEQIWNSKKKKYNYYLCGEITKTNIAQLKIPIRDRVAEMVQESIDKAKELSEEQNNPKRYLFNTYEGKLKGEALSKQILLNTIKRLIKHKDIRDINGDLYHFRLHSLRHTRAKEYVEQGMGISIIQQILGHRSLQMTVHYATVTEDTLYEKWKETEDLDLFRVNVETNIIEEVSLDSAEGENLIRYEYVKKNLDAVKVPFGVCFKPSKVSCKQQINHCLTCASFCTTIENIPEYEKEIDYIKEQIEISERCGRKLWTEKNKTYLKMLEDTLKRVREEKILHKNNASREEVV